jgi:hypothetical protein
MRPNRFVMHPSLFDQDFGFLLCIKDVAFQEHFQPAVEALDVTVLPRAARRALLYFRAYSNLITARTFSEMATDFTSVVAS